MFYCYTAFGAWRGISPRVRVCVRACIMVVTRHTSDIRVTISLTFFEPRILFDQPPDINSNHSISISLSLRGILVSNFCRIWLLRSFRSFFAHEEASK